MRARVRKGTAQHLLLLLPCPPNRNVTNDVRTRRRAPTTVQGDQADPHRSLPSSRIAPPNARNQTKPISLSIDSGSNGDAPPPPPPPPPQTNERPVIGILAQPGDPAPRNKSYIAASYVKWVEAAGARVVPILPDMSEGEVRARFRAVNGLLLPGGGGRLTPGHGYYDTAALLLKLALDANDNGDYFPVHGTCLGMEALAIIVSRNATLLADVDAEDCAAPLLMTPDAEHSRFFSSFPPRVVQNLQREPPLAMENHGHAILSEDVAANERLSAFFKVLSLSLARDGRPYVSTMEARDYPVYATQWHPEKNAYEWTSTLSIPHSPDAVEVTQESANFFVGEARRNSHAARDALEEDDFLIYNWAPDFTGRAKAHGGEEMDFEQIYVLDLEEIREQAEERRRRGRPGGGGGGRRRRRGGKEEVVATAVM
jgi:gamma-glutamyl hydrolase